MSDQQNRTWGGGVSGPNAAILTHDRLLGQRLLLHIKARFLAALTIVVGAFFAREVIGVERLDVLSLTLLAAAIAVYNSAIGSLVLPRRDPARAGEHRSVLRALLRVSMVLDFIALTAAVWLVGGARSPFLGFYLFHVVIMSLLLSRRAALLAAGLATVFLAALVIGEYAGLIPTLSPEGAVAGSGQIDGRYVITVLTVYPALFLLVSLLVSSLVRLLRRAEIDNRHKAIEVEKLSTMRKEFLRVALHDINAPFGVIGMLVRNMRGGFCGPLDERQNEQLDRCIGQLERVDVFLKDLRLLSELESADLSEHSTEISLEFLLGEVIDENRELTESHGHSVRIRPTEGRSLVFGVPRLLREAIANYIVNAITYTPDGGSITARISETPGFVRVEVTDTGVGISETDQARLFREFTRVGRSDPRTRQVKGTGLGLSLVRRIAEMHGGRVGVASEPDKGSTFWIELPICRPGDRSISDARG